MKHTLIALVAILSTTLYAQAPFVWEETDHTDEVPSHCLLAHDKTIFSGTVGGGLLYTDDLGDHWEQSDKFPAYFVVDLIKTKNGPLYAATRDLGVVVSYDEGSTWTAFNEGLQLLRTNCLFEEDDVLYLGADDGVYRLMPSGEVWEKLAFPRDVYASRTILSLAGFREKLFAGGPGVLYYSLDGGESWRVITEGFHHNVTSLLWRGNSLSIGTSGDGLLRSDFSDQEDVDVLSEGSADNAKNSVWRLRSFNGKTYKLTNAQGLIDQGVSLNNGLNDLEVRDLLKEKQYYFLATAKQGVLRTQGKFPTKLLAGESSPPFSFKVYPTVTRGEVTLDVSGADSDSDYEIMLVDSRGQIVEKVNSLTSKDQLVTHLLPADLPNGSYWIVAMNGDKIGRQLIILNR